MPFRPTPTLLLCLAGSAAVVTAAALGLGAGSTPRSTPAPAAVTAAPPAPSPPGGPGYPAPSGVTAPPAAAVLTIQGFEFVAPAVAPGAPLTVSNLDATEHTVTAKDGSFRSGAVSGGQQATVTAPVAPGQYDYFCSIHPDMTGTLTVR